MKLSLFLSLALFMQAFADGYGQHVFSFQCERETVAQVFEQLETTSDYKFLYASSDIKKLKKITYHFTNVTLADVLTYCLQGSGLTWEVEEQQVIIRPARADINIVTLMQVTGKVTSTEGEPLPGVNVVEKGTTNGTVTDIEGYYKLDVAEDAVLLFSFIGYKTQEIATEGRGVIAVQLAEDITALNETVVIGYGTSKVKDMTGSIARISTKDLENAPMGSSVQSLLQGRAAGVNVAIQSASPTSPISVMIRGASSLSGDNQPLWVVDGVPQYSSSISGNVANTLYNLNLNDVESIDILKDASATAVYGSRGANGVVIVTTKKGKKGTTPTIELSTRVGIQVQDFNEYDYFEADEYIPFAEAMGREAIFDRDGFDYFSRLYFNEQAFKDLNTSEFDKSDLQVLPGAFYDSNTNWQEEMTQNPLVTQQDLSVRGGSENVSYFISFNHQDIEGVVKSGKSELYGGRLNMDAKIRNDLTFGMNLSASFRDTDDKDYMLDVLKKIRPDIPAYNEDGSIFTRDPYTENPYLTLQNTQSGKGKTFNGTAYLEFSIIKDLLFKTSYTTNFVGTENLDYKKRGSTFNYNGSRDRSTSDISISVFENTLTYVRQFDKHSIQALGGFSMEKSKTSTYSISASNFPDDDVLNDFGSAANPGNLTETQSANALISEFARLHYKFNERYIISGTIRRDGSSRFGASKRWGVFPSGAAAWLISEENFMKLGNVRKYLSYLKLRASVGVTGSQNLGNYDWITRVGSSRYNESPAIAPSSIGNPELQWEQTKMTDIGVDFALFEDKLWGSFGVYQKLSDELIYSRPLPPSSSFTSISSNVASVRNRGIEFEIEYNLVKNENYRLTLDLNAAKNINKVETINGIVQELNFPNSYTTYMKVKPGEETGEWYGFETAGRFFVTGEDVVAFQSQTDTGGKQTYRYSRESIGDIIVIDQNGDGIIDDEDKVKLGTSNLKIFGGFGITFEYKGLLVNTAFTYAYGHKRLWSQPMDDVGYGGNYNHSNLIAGESATINNPYEATIPRMGFYGLGSNSAFSDFWLHDASYIRLNALNISYRIPSKVFKTMLIRGADITFQATNLFTITKYPGYDPQGNWSSTSIGTGMGVDNSTYPQAQIYNIGVKVTLQ